ncbi:MAG: precorrin-2 dehydrogenase/sirohydrochlorin ferrochelatase family protein [Thermoprotei archaeon]|jgi:precorrin-2 dehydrogenase/sirohydrochlorin ferrochelatase
MRVPLFVEMEGLRVLIIGGGEEGTKKARRLLSAGAVVTVLALEHSDSLRKMVSENARLRLIYGDARNIELLEKLISENDFIISALSDQRSIDDIIIELCNKHRKLYDLAGDAERTQVAMGIETNVDSFRIAMISGGLSSLAVMEALERIKYFLLQQKDLIALMHLMGDLKIFMRKKNIPWRIRKEIYHMVYNHPEIRKLVLDGNIEKAKKLAEEMALEWIQENIKVH